MRKTWSASKWVMAEVSLTETLVALLACYLYHVYLQHLLVLPETLELHLELHLHLLPVLHYYCAVAIIILMIRYLMSQLKRNKER